LSSPAFGSPTPFALARMTPGAAYYDDAILSKFSRSEVTGGSPIFINYGFMDRDRPPMKRLKGALGRFLRPAGANPTSS